MLNILLNILELIKGAFYFSTKKADKHKHYFVIKTIDDGKKLYIKNIGMGRGINNFLLPLELNSTKTHDNPHSTP